MLSNAYFLAKFRFDTAENEPAKNLQNFANFANFAKPNPLQRSNALREEEHARKAAEDTVDAVRLISAAMEARAEDAIARHR